MSERRPQRLVLRTAGQVAALSGPLPIRIVAAFERLGRATVGEVADAIGEPADTLYYHVRRLARVGVLRRWERRRTAGPTETVWVLPAREIAFDHETRAPAYLAALARSTRSLLRMAERAWHAALDAGRAKRTGPSRTLMVQQHFARLRRRDLAELNRRLEEVAAFVRDRDIGGSGDDPATPWISLTMVMSPAARSEPR